MVPNLETETKRNAYIVIADFADGMVIYIYRNVDDDDDGSWDSCFFSQMKSEFVAYLHISIYIFIYIYIYTEYIHTLYE